MKRRKRNRRHNRQRGIYLLPNVLTSANLFCGFFAMIAAVQGEFDKSAMAIMVAVLFDGLDGKIARMTNTMSRFGMEYDSLCDVISFGVAPAMLAYLWALAPFGRIGWLAALLFVTCGALRLARFNTQASASPDSYFNGLPIPAAAFTIASTVLLIHRFDEAGTVRHVTIVVMIYVLSFLMVSTVKYYSFKHGELFKKMKFNMLVAIVLLFTVIAAEPSITFFLIIFGYVLSGPLTTWQSARHNRSAMLPDENGIDIKSQEHS